MSHATCFYRAFTHLHSISVESLHMQSELAPRDLSMSRKKTWRDVRGPTAPPCGQMGGRGEKIKNRNIYISGSFHQTLFQFLRFLHSFLHHAPKGQAAHMFFIFTCLWYCQAPDICVSVYPAAWLWQSIIRQYVCLHASFCLVWAPNIVLCRRYG